MLLDANDYTLNGILAVKNDDMNFKQHDCALNDC